MNELANIYRGKSFTIGFAIPETYDTDSIEDIKINIGTKIYAHTIVQGVVKVELTSEQTARMVGKQDVVFTIQDNTFGVRKLLCGYIYVSSTISKFESESYNDVYDVMVMLSYNEGIIDVDHVLFDYLRSKSPYEIAVEEGYTGTQEEFNQALADIANKVPYEDATRNLDLTGHTVISDSAKFNTSATPAFDPAEMGWEAGEKVLSFGLEDGGRAQINKEIFDFYTNVDTVPLLEGDAVSIKQVSGNRKAIKRTDPSIKADADSIVGTVTVASIPVNGVGRVTKIGHVSPFNTSGWADNDPLYVSHTNIGKLTNTPPPAGYYCIQVGHVVVAAVSGTIDVRVRTIPKLADLSDVDGIPWNTAGQIPVLQSDGTFSGTSKITDYYTKTEANNLLDDKVDKVTGKQLSTEDYTTAEKLKVTNLPLNTASELALKFDKANLESARSQSTTKAPTSKLMDDEFNKKFDSNLVITGNNLFNKDTATLNAFIRYSNGTVATGQVGWWCSDYIPVKPNTQYRAINNVRDRAFYDARKVYISGNSDNVNTFTTPANAGYVRFSHYNSDINIAILNEGATALPYEAYYQTFKYPAIQPARISTLETKVSTLETKVSTLESDVFAVEQITESLELKLVYDSLTDVIARTSTFVQSFTDIAGVGANYNKTGVSFNAIKLYGANRGAIADSRRWSFGQVIIKNAKEDTAIIAKSPLIPVDKTLASLSGLLFPLMDSNLENFVTLNDASFAGSTYFVYHLWFNQDMSYAYGGTTVGAMSNFAGTSFYTTTHASWATYSGNQSIALEHALLANPEYYTTVPRLEDKVIQIEDEIALLQPETVEVILPDKIYAVVGDTLQLFYRGIIKAWNPYDYDIVINCSKGAWYPRYFEYTPVIGDVGTTTLQIKVKDNNGKLLGSKTCSLITKNTVKSPAAATKTLFIGDSLTNNGVYTQEAYRRLTGTGGTPAGKELTNISFVGRKPYGSIGAEGNSGWSWSDYLTVGRKAFTFAITAPTVMPTVGAIYKDSNDKQYTMQWDYSTTSVKMSVNDLSSTPPASGTLTKVSGTGDSSLTYSAAVQSSANPFWNDSTGAIDFPAYVNKWLGGAVDIVYTLLTWNGQYGNRTDFSAHTNYAKTLFAHIKANYPSIKIKLMGVQVSDLRGGVRVDGAPTENTYTDTYGLMVTALNMNKAYQDLANDPLYSDYVEFVGVSSQVDSEYNMPYNEKAVNTRFDGVTEKIGANDVHPNTAGYNQIADIVFRNFVANFCQ